MTSAAKRLSLAALLTVDEVKGAYWTKQAAAFVQANSKEIADAKIPQMAISLSERLADHLKMPLDLSRSMFVGMVSYTILSLKDSQQERSDFIQAVVSNKHKLCSLFCSISDQLPTLTDTASSVLTAALVQRAIKQKFGDEVELVKGKGYFYFVTKGSENWSSTSVYVNSINQLSLFQWLNAYQELKDQS